MAPHFEACDLVLVEGHSQTSGLKIEVWNAAASEEPMAMNDRSILALVTDDPVQMAAPIWRRSELADIARRILKLAAHSD